MSLTGLRRARRRAHANPSVPYDQQRLLQSPIEPSSNDVIEYVPDYRVDEYKMANWPYDQADPAVGDTYQTDTKPYWQLSSSYPYVPFFDVDTIGSSSSQDLTDDDITLHYLVPEDAYKNYLSPIQHQQSVPEPTNAAIQQLSCTHGFHGFMLPLPYQWADDDAPNLEAALRSPDAVIIMALSESQRPTDEPNTTPANDDSVTIDNDDDDNNNELIEFLHTLTLDGESDPSTSNVKNDSDDSKTNDDGDEMTENEKLMTIILTLDDTPGDDIPGDDSEPEQPSTTITVDAILDAAVAAFDMKDDNSIVVDQSMFSMDINADDDYNVTQDGLVIEQASLAVADGYENDDTVNL